MLIEPLPGPLERLTHPLADEAGIKLFCKRDDLFTPAPGTALQGNKVRKLWPTLTGAMAAAAPPVLVSFGGAYSNHLSALATAGRVLGLQTAIFVRGEEVDNPLLQQAERDGALLIKITRAEYRRRSDEEWLHFSRLSLAKRFGVAPSRIWIIPEGGTSPEAVRSVGALYHEIVTDLGRAPDYLCVSAGTGGTAAGLIAAAVKETHVEVYSALKGNWMEQEIRRLLPNNSDATWSCVCNYHFGGYGKFPEHWVVPSSGVAKRVVLDKVIPPLEPIYTAKLFAGVLDRIGKDQYPHGSSVVVVHTGGIY